MKKTIDQVTEEYNKHRRIEELVESTIAKTHPDLVPKHGDPIYTVIERMILVIQDLQSRISETYEHLGP